MQAASLRSELARAEAENAAARGAAEALMEAKDEEVLSLVRRWGF